MGVFRRVVACGGVRSPAGEAGTVAVATVRRVDKQQPSLESVWALVKRYPSIAVVPLLMLVVMMTLGVWGVLYAAGRTAQSRESTTRAFGETLARTLQLSIQQLHGPSTAMGVFVSRNPQWDTVQSEFPSLAPQVIVSSDLSLADVTMILWPQGIMAAAYPPYLTDSYGLDVLSPDPANAGTRDLFVAAVRMRGGNVMDGASRFALTDDIITSFLLAVYIPGAAANDTFGFPHTATDCDFCYYDQGNASFWGFVTTSTSIKAVLNETGRSLRDRGYRFHMVNPKPSGASLLGLQPIKDIMMSDKAPHGNVTVNISFTSTLSYWQLCLSPDAPYQPVWCWPLVVLVIIVSLVLAAMQFAVLSSRYQHKALLGSLLPRHVIARLRAGSWYLADDSPAMETGTPADKILTMMSSLLEGKVPPVKDVVLVRTAILESYDIYRPIDLGNQMRAALEADVARVLLQQLGDSPGSKVSLDCGGPTAGGVRERDGSSRFPPGARTSVSLSTTGTSPGGEDVQFSTLSGALAALLATSEPPEMAVVDACNVKLMASSKSLLHSGGNGDFACLVPQGHGSSSTALGSAGSSVLTGGSCKPSRLAGQMRGSHEAADCSVTGSGGGHGMAIAIPVDGTTATTTGRVGVLDAVGVAPCVDTSDEACTCSARGSPRAVLAPGPSPLHEVERVLAGCNAWDWDAFKLAEVTSGRPLAILSFYLLHSTNLISSFKMRPVTLARFLSAVEDRYLPNSYHNAVHATSVLHAMHMLLTRGGLVPGYADPLVHLGCLLSALVHDVEHGGLTNEYLTAVSHQLAVRYNDKSPLENHHCAAAFSLLLQQEYDCLKGMSRSDRIKLRKLVIELVLATDMKAHFNTVSHFSTLHRLSSAAAPIAAVALASSSNAGGPPSSPTAAPSCPTSAEGIPGSPREVGETAPAPRVCVDETERLLSLQMALKCADLGHLSAPLEVHCRWVQCLEEEFFRQGDAEKAAGLPVSPLFDRSQPGITKTQRGFFEFVALPLFHNFSLAFPGAKPMAAGVMANYNHWVALEEREKGDKDKDGQKDLKGSSPAISRHNSSRLVDRDGQRDQTNSSPAISRHNSSRLGPDAPPALAQVTSGLSRSRLGNSMSVRIATA